MITTYDYWIKAACEKHLPGYDWRLLKAQYWQESKLVPTAKSPVGASGIAQFMSATWAEWAPKAGYAGKSREDPEASIFTGACYMAHLLGKWTSPRPDIDRICLALASYNAGFGNILKAQQAANDALGYSRIIGSLPKVTGGHATETIEYTTKVLSYWVQEVTSCRV